MFESLRTHQNCVVVIKAINNISSLLIVGAIGDRIKLIGENFLRILVVVRAGNSSAMVLPTKLREMSP